MSYLTEDLKLNTMQKKAVLHKDGPALVLAIPGSGKTTLLICRTLHLINKHQIPPERILSLTFSKSAALDMNSRYKELFESSSYNISFSTIHRFCYGVLLRYFKSVNKSYLLLESKESPLSKYKLLQEIYKQVNQNFLTDDLYEELNTGIGYVKNMMLDANKYTSNIQNFGLIFQKYEAYKKEKHLIDFDDMLTMCLTLFEKKPEILRNYQDRFDYIQVDECQDTSKVQHKIIELLGKIHENIFMVADDDQSIYGFRGACPEIIVNIHKYYPKISKYVLETNYRSSHDIVSLCQDIISKNSLRHHKDSFGNSKGKAKLELIYVDTTFEQASYIIKSYKSIDASQAVLYRNNLSMIALADQLDRQDVDFSLKDIKNTFFNHWITLDMVAFLKLSLIPNDIKSFERIYFKMNAYLSKDQMLYIQKNFDGINIFDCMTSLNNLPPFKQKTLNKVKSNFEYLSQLKPELALHFIEDSLDYKAFLNQQAKRNKSPLSSFQKYLDILKLIAKDCMSISDFLHRLDELKTIIYQASKNNNPYALKLLTMHASKGLEFDYVYLTDLDQDLFPSKWAADQESEGDLQAIEEERRLFYVALSRAKYGITLIQTKFKNGQYNKASTFVKEFIKSGKDNIHIQHYKDEKPASILKGFDIGDKVLHTSFGVGQILDLYEDRVVLEFKDSTKTLSAKLCSAKKILMKL